MVRRTAEIALIDPNDEECTTAKSNLTPEKYHRFMSNNSLFIETKPTKEYLEEIFASIQATGEPGFVNVEESKRRRADYAGTNPCVSGDTDILTEEYGYTQIKDVVDTDVTVWNGYEWSKVRPRITGYNQPMVEVKFSNGTSLKCTDYHKFVLAGGERIIATELSVGDKLEKWNLPIVSNSEKVLPLFGVDSKIDSYVAGFYAGDGVISKPVIWLYGKKRNLLPLFESLGCRVSEGEERDTVHLPSHHPKHRVPTAGDTIMSRLGYLSGLLDSDGCINSKDGSVAISSVDKNFLKEVFKMLGTLGAHCSISEMKEEGEKELPANDGTGKTKVYFCNKCYRLTISAWNVRKLLELGLKTYRLKLNPSPNRNASRFVYVTEIVRRDKEPTVYCFTEPKNHTGIFNGVMTAQCGEVLLPANAVCNLTTINLTAFVFTGKRGEAAVDWVGLKQAMYLSARAGYRMTCVDLELPGWNHIHHRDRLLGCSMTGYQDFMGMLGEGFNQELFLREMRKWTRQYADDYAEELGTPKSLLVTSIKPEGCTTVEMMRTLDEGVLFLEEIYPGISSDDTPNGFHDLPLSYESEGNKVKKIYKNDIKNVRRITLKNGRILRITDEHPMSVNGEWVAGKDLEVGQVLDYKLGTYLNSRNYPLVDIDYSLYRSDAKLEKYPKEMNEDLAWLLGAYFANGCFTTYERIKFHCQHKEVHEKVQRIWKEQFGVETNIVRSTDRDSYTQDFRRIAIRQWLDSNGIKKYNEEGDMVIPEVVRRSSRACILAFIAGYADNDGCFANKSFSIDSSKEEFIRHLQQVGEAVGLCFDVSKNASRKNSFSKKPMWKAYLSRAFSDEGSIEYLNSISVKAELQGFIEPGVVKSKNPYTIVKIEDEGDEQTYDIEVDTTHCYYQGGLLSHNTLSLLAGGVSPGVHYQHSPYFIRRIRVNASDPLAKTALELGWRINPEVGQTMEDATTLVIDFPCKSTSRKTKKDVTAIEQLETYLMFQKNYTEHNSSNTISVKPDEWKGVTDFVYSHWDDILGVTFLETNSTYYPLMPYEECTKEEYEELLKITKPFDPEILNNMEITTRNLGKEFEILDDKEGCENGVCPIR